MLTSKKPFDELTAGDLMTGPVEVIHQDMTLPQAAGLLQSAHVGGAPVVDEEGRCIGMLSAADFVRWAEHPVEAPAALPRLRACIHLDGEVCKLPAGGCSVQAPAERKGGKEVSRCLMPHCVLADWQVPIESLPGGAARQFMTADPVMVSAGTLLTEVMQMMVDAHIHRVIVVDEDRRPIGVVSTTDVLAAVVRYGQAGAEAARR